MLPSLLQSISAKNVDNSAVLPSITGIEIDQAAGLTLAADGTLAEIGLAGSLTFSNSSGSRTPTGGVGAISNYESGLGLALNLNGATQYANYSANTGALVGGGTTPWTFEAWIYVNVITRCPIIGNGYLGMWLTALGYLNLPNTGATGTTAIATGTWTHVAMTYDGTNVRFFVNGVLGGTIAEASTNSMTGPYTLGNNGVYFFDGYIDEVRASNICRWTSTFTPSVTPYVTDANTVMLYHCDEGSGTTVSDSSGNGYNLTLVGGPGYVPGKVSQYAINNMIERGMIGGKQQVLIGALSDAQVTFEAPVYVSPLVDNPLTVAHTMTTQNAMASATCRLLSIQNQGVEKFGLFCDGSLSKLPLLLRVPFNTGTIPFETLTAGGEIKFKIDNDHSLYTKNAAIIGAGDQTVGGTVAYKAYVPTGAISGCINTTPISTAYVNTTWPKVAAFTPYTIEFWLYLTGTANFYSSFLLRCTGADNGASSSCHISGGYYGGSNNRPFFSDDRGESLFSPTPLVANTWTHVAFVVDGTGTGYIYQNGVLAISGAWIGYGIGQHWLGSQSDGTTSFPGYMDEVRISNIARYTNTAGFTPPTGPFATDAHTVALYHLNEGSGNTFTDSSGNGYNCTGGANVAWVTGNIATSNATRNTISQGWTSGSNYCNVGDTADNTTNLQGIQTVLAGGIRHQIYTITTGGSYNVLVGQHYIVVNKSSGSATAVVLPTASAGDLYVVKDAKGDAGANNITITTAAGNIDGSASKVINTNYGVLRLIYDGSNWFTV